MHVEARTWPWVSSSISLFLIFWDRGSHWTWVHRISDRNPPVSASPALELHHIRPCLTFYMGAEASNLGAHFVQQALYLRNHLSLYPTASCKALLHGSFVREEKWMVHAGVEGAFPKQDVLPWVEKWPQGNSNCKGLPPEGKYQQMVPELWSGSEWFNEVRL